MPQVETAQRPELAFSRESHNAMVIAKYEAKRMGHTYIGVEHILLGLVQNDDHELTTLLGNKGISPSKLRSAVEFIVGTGPETYNADFIQDPHAKKAIELAHEEARKDGADIITTAHLLIGVIREGDGIAGSILESMGVMYVNLYPEVVKLKVPEVQRKFPALRKLITVLSDERVGQATKDQLNDLIAKAVEIAKSKQVQS